MQINCVRVRVALIILLNTDLFNPIYMVKNAKITKFGDKLLFLS